jgi:3-dehydro-L-gulonate 2-dehydrogenase
MLAAMLSGGLAAHQIPQESTRESGLSQIFLAIDPSAPSAPSTFATRQELDRIAAGILDSLRAAVPVDPARPVRYPGEQTLRLRQENLKLGVPVDPAVWARLLALSF